MKKQCLFFFLWVVPLQVFADQCPDFSGQWKSDLEKKVKVVIQTDCEELSYLQDSVTYRFSTDGRFHHNLGGLTKSYFKDGTFIVEYWTATESEQWRDSLVWKIYSDSAGVYLQEQTVDPESGQIVSTQVFTKK